MDDWEYLLEELLLSLWNELAQVLLNLLGE
jgi:hypothetical protein